jgi:Tfp pilus assembly protein PilF
MSSGNQYLTTHKYAEAAIEFENAARVDPRSAAVQTKLGEVYVALDQPVNAAAAYEQACQLNDTDAAVCLRATSLLLSIGEFNRATTPARAVLAQDRFNVDAQLMLASALAGTRRFADAEERIQALLAAAPGDARAYKALGDVQRQRGRDKAAEASFRKALDLDPKTDGARVSLAELFFERGRTSDGERELRAALAANPDDVAANRTYASYLVGTERCDSAEAYWKKAAEQSNAMSDWLALADYYVWSGRTDDALGVLSKVSNREGGGAARTRAASILYDRGDHDKSGTMVDQVLQQEPSNVSGLLLKARMALDARDTATARDYAHRAAAIAPSSAAVRDMLASLNDK